MKVLYITLSSVVLLGTAVLLQMNFFNSPEKRNNQQKSSSINKPVEEKFALFVDLGTIVVPEDYVHESRITTFETQHRKNFHTFSKHITDGKFQNPSRILLPGDRIRVRVFKQVVGGTTTSKERMAFLATQKAIYLGAQGSSLVFEQKRDQLPVDKWYVSFDEKQNLWQYGEQSYGLPRIDCYSVGGFSFSISPFDWAWKEDDVFFCFNNETL